MSSPFEERLEAATQRGDVQEEFPAPIQTDIIALVNLGRLEESFSLFDHEFVIKTLNMDEELQIEQLLSDKFSSVWNDKGFRTALVASSIVSMDNFPLVTSIEIGESTLGRAFNKVKKWYRPVIFALYERCEALQARQQQALDELSKKA